jgi:hypothetical protein
LNIHKKNIEDRNKTRRRIGCGQLEALRERVM